MRHLFLVACHFVRTHRKCCHVASPSGHGMWYYLPVCLMVGSATVACSLQGRSVSSTGGVFAPGA